MFDLQQGDCLELLSHVKPGSIRLVLADLPYGTTGSHWDHLIPMEELWPLLWRALAPNGVVALNCTQPFTSQLITSNPTDFRYLWYWDKVNVTGFQIAKKQPLRHIEDIAVFYRKFPTYNPQGLVRLDAMRTNGSLTRAGLNGRLSGQEHKTYKQEWTNWPRHLLRFPREKGVHETQKPVGLLSYLIRTYSNKGETVLDCCMGSGSTGVAAMHTGRRFIGMELDPHNFAVAEEAIRKARPPLDRMGGRSVRPKA